MRAFIASRALAHLAPSAAQLSRRPSAPDHEWARAVIALFFLVATLWLYTHR